MSMKRNVLGAPSFVVALLLAGCGGGGGNPKPPPPTPTFTIAGTLTGLAGSGLVLQNNGGNNLSVAQNGAFSFPNGVASGTSYNVTVLTNPSNPAQGCTVSNGSGTVSGNVTNVTVTCVTGQYTIGGTVSGLASGATGLVLINNGGDSHTINTNGAFTFPTSVASGSAYDIRVLSQPYDPYQNCVVENGSGTVSNAPIAATITCANQVPKFATSLDFGTGTYSQYAIDAATGQLRSRGYVTVGASPVDVGAFGTDAKISFVLSRGASTLHAFVRDIVTGRVTEAPNSPQATDAIPTLGDNVQTGASSMTIHPRLPFVYVANGGGKSTISAFRFDTNTGAMAEIAGSPFAAGNRPLKVAIDPTGRFAFTTNRDSENISVYTIDQTTGALAANGNPIATGGSIAMFPIIHPTGKFLYVPNGGGSISAFVIGANGTLTAVPNSPFAVSSSVTASLIFHPSGRYVFMKLVPSLTAPGAVASLNIDQATGALSLIGTPIEVGVSPTTLSGEASGRYLFVANRGAAPYASHPQGSISVLRINAATGELTSAANVNLTPAPYSVSLDWSGKYLYSASAEGNLLRTFAFNMTSGAATPIADAPEIFGRGAPVTLIAIPSSNAEPAKFKSKFAYLPDTAGSAIRAFTVNSSGVFTATTGVTNTPDLSAVQSVAVTPHSRRLVAVNSGGAQNARTFPINATTGALGASATPAAAGTNPVEVVADPSGRFAYVADELGDAIRPFVIDSATGNLTALTASPAQRPKSLALHPNGYFLYYVTDSEWGVRTINGATGALSGTTELNGLGSGQTAVAVHPDGQFVYVTRFGSPDAIDVYRVTTTGNTAGTLTADGTPVASGGAGPVSIAIHPNGRFLYVANRFGNNVAAFRVEAPPQTLSAIGSPVPVTAPVSVRVDYSGNHLYAVDNAGQIRTFAINATSGVLTDTTNSVSAVPQELSLSEDIE